MVDQANGTINSDTVTTKSPVSYCSTTVSSDVFPLVFLWVSPRD